MGYPKYRYGGYLTGASNVDDLAILVEAGSVSQSK